ncbi:MAG TPA: hypothetical protein VNX68_00460 [Nitrosopumilaceae archaeon]|nr:hypothetical protein [Nitrosopumilaceae archaeon]
MKADATEVVHNYGVMKGIDKEFLYALENALGEISIAEAQSAIDREWRKE